MNDILKTYISERGISIVDLAHESGVSRATIYRLINDQHEPELRTMLKLADALGVSNDKIINTFKISY